MTEEEQERWAKLLIQSWNDNYEYCLVYEDEELTDEYPNEDDWEKVFEKMCSAKIGVTWDE